MCWRPNHPLVRHVISERQPHHPSARHWNLKRNEVQEFLSEGTDANVDVPSSTSDTQFTAAAVLAAAVSPMPKPKPDQSVEDDRSAEAQERARKSAKLEAAAPEERLWQQHFEARQKLRSELSADDQALFDYLEELITELETSGQGIDEIFCKPGLKDNKGRWRNGPANPAVNPVPHEASHLIPGTTCLTDSVVNQVCQEYVDRVT